MTKEEYQIEESLQATIRNEFDYSKNDFISPRDGVENLIRFEQVPNSGWGNTKNISLTLFQGIDEKYCNENRTPGDYVEYFLINGTIVSENYEEADKIFEEEKQHILNKNK